MFEGDLKQYEIPAPVVETKTQRILRTARAMIQESDCWVKGGREVALEPGKTGFCIVGAVAIAGYGDAWGVPQDAPELRALFNALPARWHRCGGVFASLAGGFNDDPTTTHADVLALFDRAYQLAASPT